MHIANVALYLCLRRRRQVVRPQTVMSTFRCCKNSWQQSEMCGPDAATDKQPPVNYFVSIRSEISEDLFYVGFPAY